jgi:predicted nucleotidyltransferase
MKEDRLLIQYRKEVLPAIIRLFSPVKVMIFGSRVKGTATKDSDIDVIIVSESFTGIPFVRRMALVMKSARFKKHVDYLCYTPEEFERLKNTSSILRDAVGNAIEVAL